MSKNYEVINLNDTCGVLLKLKKNKDEFNRDIAKILKFVSGPSEEINTELGFMASEINELNMEYCEKDSDGKPIIERVKTGEDSEGTIISRFYKGLLPGECKEYDDRLKEISLKRTTLLKSESSVNLADIDVKIWKKDLPLNNDAFEGVLQAIIQDFIVE